MLSKAGTIHLPSVKMIAAAGCYKINDRGLIKSSGVVPPTILKELTAFENCLSMHKNGNRMYDTTVIITTACRQWAVSRYIDGQNLTKPTEIKRTKVEPMEKRKAQRPAAHPAQNSFPRCVSMYE